MSRIADILGQFEPISLHEMNGVKLMDRMDTKFAFHISQLPEALSMIRPFYRALDISGKRMARYKTLYYDTPDMQLYTLHHNGKLNRYKVRHRTYLDSGLGFLEVKHKTNKGRTIKDRITEKTPLPAWDHEAASFLGQKTPYGAASLVPTVCINYSRITLVSKSSSERLTIDLDLEFDRNGVVSSLGQLVIAEVKQEKAQASHYIDTMKHLRIKEGSISKYCMAVAYTYPDVKKNSFKEKLLSIQKIIYHAAIANH